MTTNMTHTAKIEHLNKFVEKTDHAYEDIARRVKWAADKHELRDLYNEAALMGSDMTAATVILEILEENGELETYARRRGITAENWVPRVRTHVTDSEALTREIMDRTHIIAKAEVAAENYLNWKNATTYHLTLEDIDTSFLNSMNDPDAVGIPMREAITALGEKPGLMESAGDEVKYAAKFFDRGHWDLVREIREALVEAART